MAKNLEIHDFFDGIYGSSPEAPHKADVIHQALQTHQLAPEQAIIIGDIKFDMLGSSRNRDSEIGHHLGIWRASRSTKLST